MQENIKATINDAAADFIKHSDILYGFAYRLAQNADDAKDLVQDTFLRALKYADHYTPGTNARSWLYRIMYNLFINQYRKQRRSPIVAAHEHEEDRGGQYTISPDAFRNSMSDEVMLAFNQLKPEFKSVLYLRDFEDLKYEEISHVLDIPICTVKTRIHRARLYMRQTLSKLKTLAKRN